MKKTKKQDEIDKFLAKIEFTVDDFLNSLREEIEKEGLKKKHKIAVADFAYLVNKAKSRLWPRTGPLHW